MNEALEKAQAEYAAACEVYDKKTSLPTQTMKQDAKLAHARACSELYEKKRAAKLALDNLLKNKCVNV